MMNNEQFLLMVIKNKDETIQALRAEVNNLENQVAELEDECGRLYSDSIEIMG